jgi:hypothetical protein
LVEAGDTKLQTQISVFNYISYSNKLQMFL